MAKTVEIITSILSAEDVKQLPKGAIVGDPVGGRSFADNVAVALERRSASGWQDIAEEGKRWTVIVVDR